MELKFEGLKLWNKTKVELCRVTILPGFDNKGLNSTLVHIFSQAKKGT